MKKLLILATLILLGSCSKAVPIENYKESIVYEKYTFFGYYFSLKVKNEFIEIRTLKYDYNKYNIGDTIK